MNPLLEGPKWKAHVRNIDNRLQSSTCVSKALKKTSDSTPCPVWVLGYLELPLAG